MAQLEFIYDASQAKALFNNAIIYIYLAVSALKSMLTLT